jgi:hypothetical protein
MRNDERNAAIEVQEDGSQITITVRAAAAPADELIPVTATALEPLQLEYRPVVALAQSGTLRTVWIGRRRYTKRSWLLALADELPAATQTAPDDDLAIAAAKRAARGVR